ncbi:MAG: hypothetical protein ACRDIY_23650, partial [Chloroflexota bacterium]
MLERGWAVPSYPHRPQGEKKEAKKRGRATATATIPPTLVSDQGGPLPAIKVGRAGLSNAMVSFDVAHGDDPEGIYLKATVDLADVEEIVDQELLDRLFEFQVEQGLPVYVIPLQPVERVLQEMQKRPARSLSCLP